ncbi:Cytochrome P450 4C1 [Acromyrmex echinatior]|uniref:Cytochrome P450 4C1 n=1 Tax=Acromyrmex echinatior TaxID=103372 RepID=F4X5X6_ACREC|nr:Cytochrome P450 4C1 [Acromyrmex echinatior]
MIVIVLILFVIILLSYYYYVHYGRNGRLINLIPGPPGYPIIGNTLLLQGSRENLWKRLITITDKYYPICKIWTFFIPIVSIRDPDDMEVILNNMKHINKSIIYDVLRPWFNTGLLTSGGTKWQTRRKILTPAFHFNILQHFIESLIEEGENMTKSLKNTGGTVVKDLIPFISEHTLNAICETAMGTSLRDQSAYQQRYRKAVHQIGEIIIYRLMRQWLRYNWIFSLMPKGKKQAETLRILHGFTERIIEKRKLCQEYTDDQYLKDFDSNTMTETSDVETIKIRKKRLALLDILIAASRKGLLTDSDIREEVDTFMFEGHDTVAKGICFALLLLAEHKDIQNRVRDEIRTTIEKTGEKFTINVLQNLSYLDRCIKEALRLYPSVYFISRITSEDVKFKSYIIPAKTIVHLNIYGLHRDPNFWPNPEIFDPDRFLSENIRNRHPYSYLPFSAGPRNCIGQRFALLEMKAMIASLIHNFYLEPIDYLKDLQMEVDLVLHPAHPLQDLWKFQRRLCKNYYPIYKLWCGPIAFVSIHHPDDLEKVLGSAKEHLSKGYLYDALIPWLGTGLLTSEVKKRRLAMLDLLIAAVRNDEMDDVDIREEVDTFVFEGHDTVAVGLTYAILLLAEHEDVQKRARNEISAIMEANGGKLTMSALNNMPYLERCLKESLRLYPSVPFISRVLSKDLQTQTYLVPSGTIVHLNIYDIHRDPNFWPNPDVFDPDRFLLEKIQKRHPYSYLPFSAGPRNCIGQRFAMMELKAIIATLIYNFYLEPIDYLKDLQFKTDLTSRVTQPIRTRFVPINRTSKVI